MTNLVANAGVAMGYGAAHNAGVRIDLPAERTWQFRWQRTLQLHDELVAACSMPGHDLDGDVTPEVVYDFADSCWEVKDALIRNSGVSKRKVERHASRTGCSLRLVGDVTNTNKHWGRAAPTAASMRRLRLWGRLFGKAPREKPKRVAWVSPLFRRPEDGCISLFVSYDDDNGTRVERDAVKLANDAVEEWRVFFRNHSLSETP